MSSWWGETHSLANKVGLQFALPFLAVGQSSADDLLDEPAVKVDAGSEQAPPLVLFRRLGVLAHTKLRERENVAGWPFEGKGRRESFPSTTTIYFPFLHSQPKHVRRARVRSRCNRLRSRP
jgi:hypothetical protein